MAKTGEELESESQTETTRELKRELERVVMCIDILERDDDYSVDRAIHTLNDLKKKFKFNLKHPSSSSSSSSVAPTSSLLEKTDLPHQFRCPISRQLMLDPVILATGQVISFIIHTLFQLLILSFM